ncbi:hypothetical protein Tco_0594757 [Tanacetum coccineum]
MQEAMQQFIDRRSEACPLCRIGKLLIGNKMDLKIKRDGQRNSSKGIIARLVTQALPHIWVFMRISKGCKSAFLYGEIVEEVFVTQPKDFDDPHFLSMFTKFVKVLYGLHTKAPRAGLVDNIIFGSTKKDAGRDELRTLLKKFDMESVRTATTPYDFKRPNSKDELR